MSELQQTNSWRHYWPQLLSQLICVSYLLFSRGNSMDCVCSPVPAKSQICISQCLFHLYWCCNCRWTRIWHVFFLKLHAQRDVASSKKCMRVSPTASRFVQLYLIEGLAWFQKRSVLWWAVVAWHSTFSVLGMEGGSCNSTCFWAILCALRSARKFTVWLKAFCIYYSCAMEVVF